MDIQVVHVMDENTIKWPWALATYVWNVDEQEFADLYGRSWDNDPTKWLAKTWGLKDKDPLWWLSSLSPAQVDRIQDQIRDKVRNADFPYEETGDQYASE